MATEEVNALHRLFLTLKFKGAKLRRSNIYCQRSFVANVNRCEPEPSGYYGFSFDGDLAHCREGYADADALLVHLKNVGHIIEEALKISELARLEVHAPAAELAKLRMNLYGDPRPEFFTLEFRFSPLTG